MDQVDRTGASRCCLSGWFMSYFVTRANVEGGVDLPGSGLLPASVIPDERSEKEHETRTGGRISPSWMSCEAVE